MSQEPGSEKTQVIGPPVAPDPASSRLHQNALPTGARLGEFEIIDLVGEGGFGIVYLAQDHSLHRKVALKEYMPALLASRGKDASVAVRSERQRETFDLGLRSFVNEARMLAQFDHPALIKVYRFWEANGTAYMVMPFLSGQTLQDVLRERGEAPSEAWIRGLLSPLMEALVVLHEDQVFHRDIAPDNIMLLAGDRPVLLDFGAARRVISDMTHALTVILKPGYAPIEQYADMPGMKQGPWTDVYALAAVVYFMILKRKPPPAVGRLMEDSYEPLATSEAAGRYSARLLEGVDRCLRVRAEDRPQSMTAMREAIGLAPAAEVTMALPTAYAPSPPTSPPPGVAVPPAARTPTLPPVAPMRTRTQAIPTQASKVTTVTGASAPVSPAPTPDLDLDLAVDTAEPVADISLYADVESAPVPEKRNRMPLVVGSVVTVVAFVAASAFFAMKKAPVPAPVVATAPPPASAVAASAPVVVVAPPAPRIATLGAAIDAALAAADPRYAVTLEAPPAAAVGGELGVVVRSAADGHASLFVWDQAADRIHRLAPDDKAGGGAVKANGSVAMRFKDAAKRDAQAPLGRWRLLAMVSERPRDVAAAAFVPEGEGFVAERAALEAKLAADGLSSLVGKAQCAPAEPCPDRYGIAVAEVAQEAAPPPVAKRGPPAKTPPPTATPGRKNPDSEREYMKRLNKDLDTLLGK